MKNLVQKVGFRFTVETNYVDAKSINSKKEKDMIENDIKNIIKKLCKLNILTDESNYKYDICEDFTLNEVFYYVYTPNEYMFKIFLHFFEKKYTIDFIEPIQFLIYLEKLDFGEYDRIVHRGMGDAQYNILMYIRNELHKEWRKNLNGQYQSFRLNYDILDYNECSFDDNLLECRINLGLEWSYETDGGLETEMTKDEIIDEINEIDFKSAYKQNV